MSTVAGGRLYEMVEDRIATMIDDGAFRPGERIPSIRKLSRQMKVSVNTVKEAYERLEMRRLIEAKPQSGYYVTQEKIAIPRPHIHEGDLVPADITIGELYRRIMHDHDTTKLIQLGVARPDPSLLPADKLSRGMYRASQDDPARSVSYSMPPGDRTLREQIARHALTTGCALNPDEIVITAGCTEAVMLSLLLTCSPGDTVVTESPVYFNFLQLFEALRLKVLQIPVDPVAGMNLDVLEYALDRNRVSACLAITNYTNPLGSRMSDADKERLVAILEECGVPLIEDDVYGELSHTDVRPTVAKAYESDGGVLLCSSFSKTLAPGYRVGWVAGGRYRDRLERIKMATNVAVATPTQIAIGRFLASGGYERYLRRIRRVYARNVALMREAIGDAFPEGTRVSQPSGGFVLWVELPESVDGIELYRAALGHGISIAPGVLFDTAGRFRHHVRITAAMFNDEIAAAVRTVGELACERMRSDT